MPAPEVRYIDEDGVVKKIKTQPVDMGRQMLNVTGERESIMNIFPYAVSRSQVERVIKTMRLPARVTKNMDDADVLMLLQSYKKHRKVIDAAENRQIPVYLVRSNTIYQIQKSLRQIMQLDNASPEEENQFRDMDQKSSYFDQSDAHGF